MKIQKLNLTDKMGPHEMRKKNTEDTIYLSAVKNNYQRILSHKRHYKDTKA